MSWTFSVDYSTKIPNNVGLAEDRQVLRALERWHPGYIDWWMSMGPEGFQNSLVYLRTAVSVDPKGWAKFDYVKMPEYRWGILLAPRRGGPQDSVRHHNGEPAWQEVPGEYRAMLRRLIVIQGDTEPASVEQQRHLGKTAPSLYDMRNLFQVNVEEGRHLWAMVYLLQKYFGRDGREEADELLQRRSGDPDKPRMLGAFNEATPDWLSFFMFTFFTDRDGKMQLESLAQSGFDPLSRTCRFMLTEEAHHMFVGETGIGRTLQRTCEAMKEAGIEDPNDIEKVRALGVIDLPTMQKKLNLHYTLSLDLFGSEVSTNAANAFNASLKGRFQETKIEDDHRLENATYPVLKLVDGEIKRVDEPALTAINMRLRDDYTADCQRGLDRWNKIIERTGVRVQARAAARRLPPPDRRVQGRQGDARRRAHRRRHLGTRQGQVAAVQGRRRLHPEPDEARHRARPVRELDRAAARRHRQQAGRLRVREDRGVKLQAATRHCAAASSIWFGVLEPRGISVPSLAELSGFYGLEDVSGARVVAAIRLPMSIAATDLIVPQAAMEGTMTDQSENRSRDLHPLVYVGLVGLTLWLVLAIWGFGYDGETDYLLTVVTGFLVMAVAIPSTLALMVYRQRDRRERKNERDAKSFREWVAGDFDTWQDRVKGRNAAVEVLLPMAAIAIGMTAFALVLHFTGLAT